MSIVLLILGGMAQAMVPKGKEEIEVFKKVARRAQRPLRQWQQRAQQINQELMQQQQNNNVRHVPYQPQILQRRQ